MSFVTAIEIAQTILPTKDTKENVFQFVRLFCETNHNSPSVREICAAIDVMKGRELGKTSTSTANHHLDTLLEEGRIEMPVDASGKRMRSGRILIVDYDELEETHSCGDCGRELELVRPGKYQCSRCEK